MKRRMLLVVLKILAVAVLAAAGAHLAGGGDITTIIVGLATAFVGALVIPGVVSLDEMRAALRLVPQGEWRNNPELTALVDQARGTEESLFLSASMHSVRTRLGSLILRDEVEKSLRRTTSHGLAVSYGGHSETVYRLKF